MPEFALCRVDQLVEGRGRPARAAHLYLAVFLVDGAIHVIDNQCLHVASPLDGGAVLAPGEGPVQHPGPVVLCPWHGWAYDLVTGDHLTGFGPRPGVRVYDHAVVDGAVVVTVPMKADGAVRD